MMGALTAEVLKLLRHRAMWGLVWIFPLGVTLIFLLGLAFHHAHGTMGPSGLMQPAAGVWIAGTIMIWKGAASGPGRFFVGAFTALAFGGEYGWNTWKLIVPHRRRLQLIGAKYLAASGLMMLSFAMSAALAIAFSAISASLNDGGLPPGIELGALASAHEHEALVTLISTLLTMGYASAGAIILRSTMGGAIIAVAAVVLEGLAGAIAPFMNPTLFLCLPSYHLSSLSHWIETGASSVQLLSTGPVNEPWLTSLAWIAAWTVTLFAATAVIFDRQDLN